MQFGDDRGSTIPLILGFWLLGLLVVAGSVALGDAFMKQRDLQAVCDGATLAAAASAVRTDRGVPLAEGRLRFGDAAAAVEDYLSRSPSRATVRADVEVADDDRTVHLVCEQTNTIAFGALFGKADGIRQRVTASSEAHTRAGP